MLMGLSGGIWGMFVELQSHSCTVSFYGRRSLHLVHPRGNGRLKEQMYITHRMTEDFVATFLHR